MDSLIEFYFRLISYINANWKKYIELFKKMSALEKSIQCFLFVIEIIIIFYATAEVVKDTDSIMYRPQKVRPKNLTFWRSVFLWLNIILNLKRKSY